MESGTYLASRPFHMREETHHVVLIPGFFSFGNFGKVRYFDPEVSETLREAFNARGHEVNIIEVPSQPTASIRHRAARALDVIAQVAREHSGPIHLIGHSTGGLDARLAITPTAALPSQVRDEVYERIASLITVSSPHFGTPLARLFGSSMGGPLTRLLAGLSLLILRRGRLPLRAGIQMGSWFTRADDWIGLKGTVLDEAYQGFLGDFDEQAERDLIEFAQAIRDDHSLIFQLTGAGCDLLNAATGDPSRIRFGSVVTCGAAPSTKNVRRGRHDLYAQLLHALYFLLYHGNRRTKLNWLPRPTPPQLTVLERDLKRALVEQDNDGIVPCWSQVWGQVIAAAHGDHLDVVGHFGSPDEAGSSDWLPSYSGFSREHFRTIWEKCAAFLLEGRNAAQLTREEQGTSRLQVDAGDAHYRRSA